MISCPCWRKNCMMHKSKVGIVGYGHVGKAMKELFEDAIVYDEPLAIGNKEEINACDAAFVCVPTPANSDGSCNTDIVEKTISWLETPVIILRSTVYVGFTDSMAQKYGKEIVFQPEYYGETVSHPYSDLKKRSWLTFGGSKKGINLAICVYKDVVNSSVVIHQASAKEAELAKYMENSFFATKVSFCNEFYDIAKGLGVDYNVVRELWLADERIGRYHTFVYEHNRGFGGSCLPKDTAAIINQSEQNGIDVSLLKSVIEKNTSLKRNNE